MYRAAMLRAKAIDAKDADTYEAESSELFFRASIETAQLWGVRGPGTRYEGPIHDVSITRPQTRFHIVKDGKSYGTLRGFAEGWLYLPPTATPQYTPPIEADRTDSVDTPGVLIHESQQEYSEKGFTPNKQVPTVDRRLEAQATTAESNAIEVSIDDTRPEPGRRSTSARTELPYFSLCAAMGLLLWFTCSAEQTWIWCLFMLPTLGMRRLVLEVLPDDRGVEAFAAATVLGAILSSGTIFAGFNTQNCWTLETVPLVILVGSVFLSGIVPYRLALAITALAFAGVLYVWGHAPERHCVPEVPSESLPTIKDPGVPRTNDDGTWPRRPGGSSALTD